ncbi:MAG: ABC transporter ATP-binding protein [Alphaproteobacteria bacterium]|nr:ABC transporter ATP-binding protein [Alphaproteobacteria bacterium]
MASPLLVLRDIHLTFGGPPLLSGVEIAIHPGDAIGLVGRNGSGKSTLLKIAAGLLEVDQGERAIQSGATIRYLPQEPDLSGVATTRAFVEAGMTHGNDPNRVRRLLEQLGFTGDEEPSTLSGGEARRCALAQALAPKPDILLLDEPTNHLDLPAIEWLEVELKSLSAALVIVSHDRRLLERLTRTTIWLDRGATRRVELGFAEFETWREQQLEIEENQSHKIDRKIAAEESWLRYGVSARRKRNQKRLADLYVLRRGRREARRVAGVVKLATTEDQSSGKLVIETKRVAKSFGDQAIVRDLTLRIMRTDRLGIVGPNGAGKTTLLNLLTGALQPDSGRVSLGANLQIVTLDQSRASLGPAMTLREALTPGGGEVVTAGGSTKHVAAYMSDFLFTPEQARMPVSALSGGERGRVLLARALAQPSNVLVLDEPTNDLDLETLDLLQEMLNDYPGTVLLVSHDRDFLDRVVSSVLAFEGDGRWIEYAGGYSDMVAQRGHGVLAKVTPKPVPAKAPSAPSTHRAKEDSLRKRRLGFKQQHALKTLPSRIADLQAKAAKIQKTLSNPALFQRDAAQFKLAAAELAAAQAALSAAEEEWLQLELLREEIEG